jgi:hypothetical protein
MATMQRSSRLLTQLKGNYALYIPPVGRVSVDICTRKLIGCRMNYRNSEMKLDQLIGYFNDNKINLIPPFQRGHVWTIKTRQALIKNIVHGRPIPAIFLYKEEVGSKYTYNILDGKQRLESLLLFVGNARTDVGVKGVLRYFISEAEKKSIDFPIETEDGYKTFAQLPHSMVRDFREYAIPTIEINLEGSSLDEIIQLFIDINQQGVRVNRFDIVKAMGKNKLLESVFDLIAEKQKRGKDIFYKKRNTAFTRVLERLQIIQNLSAPNAKVDRMWERLLEIVLFCRTKKHRRPSEILKSFMHVRDENEKSKIAPSEKKQLQICFNFLADCYKSSLAKSRFATDQTHFYTMVTSLLSSGLLFFKNGVAPDTKMLQQKILAFAKMIDDATLPKNSPKLSAAIKEYREISQKQTTDASQREERERLFLQIIDDIPV